MQYFDVKAKMWKPLASTAPIVPLHCYCVAAAGSNLYVAGYDGNHHIYRYDTEGSLWEKLSHHFGEINNLCIVDEYMYAISSRCNQVHQRYSFAKRQWQTFAEVRLRNDQRFFCNGAAVLNSKLYVLYGRLWYSEYIWFKGNAGLHCFDPVKNEWEEKATTRRQHFGSSLFVVNNKLYVAGGKTNIDAKNGSPSGDPALVEMYDEENNTWSVVKQKHIPRGKPNARLNAVEIEGKVFFIINKFPVDSGIRIPPGERYPVHLGEWEKLAKIAPNAVLCYLPVKRKSLKSE